MAEQQDRKTEVVEEGDIFFLYRPRVGEDDPGGLEDIQRFHLVLRPRGGGKVRLCVVGRKRMPKAAEHERVWGFVDSIAESGAKLESRLQEDEYDTATRGKRRLPAVRPAGEGVYAVTLEDGQMHLSYALELPEEPGEVQRALNIAPEAAYALSVKNPRRASRRAPASPPIRRRTILRNWSGSFAVGVSSARTSACSTTRVPSSSSSVLAAIRKRLTASISIPIMRTTSAPTPSAGCAW